MFGYICINKQELKGKDYDRYRGYYCGLCRKLKKRYGRTGQMLLNYDMTFLIILLEGLYEKEETEERHRCIAHPMEKHRQILSELTDYAADMNVLLSYHKALDDWNDEHSILKRILARKLSGSYYELKGKYPRQARALEENIRKLAQAERSGCEDLDYVAGLTGSFLAELCVWKEDEWAGELRMLGYYLGKFIYLMDAFEDMEKDRKSGNYNLFLRLQEKKGEEFRQEAEGILVDMMTNCARVFERLPVVHCSEILKNILYSGVWCRYSMILKKREEKA